MKKTLTILFCVCALNFYVSAQSQGTGNSTSAFESTSGFPQQGKGTFFLSPFYEFTRFQDLDLNAQTNFYTVPEGSHSYEFLPENLDEYNDSFDTEYRTGISGLKAGYQIFDGFGLSAFAGVSHFSFKNYVSNESSQFFNTEYPAINLGTAVNYERSLYKKIKVMSIFSVNYTKSGKPIARTNSGQEVLTSNLKSVFWELNLAIAYPIGWVLPFGGVGYTQQYINSIYKEQFLISDEFGNDFYEKAEFDAHYLGSSFYGFIGVECKLTQNASIYLKSSLPNPYRANFGFTIGL